MGLCLAQSTSAVVDESGSDLRAFEFGAFVVGSASRKRTQSKIPDRLEVHGADIEAVSPGIATAAGTRASVGRSRIAAAGLVLRSALVNPCSSKLLSHTTEGSIVRSPSAVPSVKRYSHECGREDGKKTRAFSLNIGSKTSWLAFR